jgi:hypothetical protein
MDAKNENSRYGPVPVTLTGQIRRRPRAGRRTLNPLIVVRIHASEPTFSSFPTTSPRADGLLPQNLKSLASASLGRLP